MCLLRCRGATPPPGSSTVMRLSCRWPRRLWPAKVPGPSKRTSLSRLGVGDVDLPAHRVDGHVEEDGADALVEAAGAGDCAGGLALASITNTSLSGSEKLDVLVPGAAELVDPVRAVRT